MDEMDENVFKTQFVASFLAALAERRYSEAVLANPALAESNPAKFAMMLSMEMWDRVFRVL